jgi:histone-lysine N-methyltransferase SETMAR
MWVPKDGEKPEAVKQDISTRKCLLTLVISREKVLHYGLLPEKQTMNSTTYISEVLLPLKKKLEKENLLGTVFLHNDNASCHRSQVTTDVMKEVGVSMMNQPPYSPDLSPCDFFAFGVVKRMLAGLHHTSRDNLEKTLVEIFKEFSPMVLKRTFANWMRRLKYVIVSGGRYYSESKDRDLSAFHLTYPPEIKK